MSFLSSEQISKYIEGDLFKNKLASLDLSISNQYLEYDSKTIDIGNEETYSKSFKNFENLVLNPMETKLLKLSSKINLDIQYTGFIFPRYSFTSLGINIAPIVIQPGYSGQVLISVTNMHSDKIIKGILPGMKLVQIMLAPMISDTDSYSGLTSSKYVNDFSFSGSRAFSDEEITAIVSASNSITNK
jgi:deoxycytidine triphosphate deaminase